jgi:iron complex outermembrane receptor protein
VDGNPRGGPGWVASYEFQETRDGDTHQLLSDSPRTLAKLDLSERFLRKTLTASMDAQYRSRTKNTDGVSISPFTLFNLTLVGHAIGRRLDVSASVYNVLNKQHADPAPGANLQDEIAGNGRCFRVQMTWHSAAK